MSGTDFVNVFSQPIRHAVEPKNTPQTLGPRGWNQQGNAQSQNFVPLEGVGGDQSINQQECQEDIRKCRESWVEAAGSKGPCLNATIMAYPPNKELSLIIARSLGLQQHLAPSRRQFKRMMQADSGSKLWSLPHEHNSLPQKRETLRHVLLALSKWPDLEAEIFSDEEGASFLAQLATRVSHVCGGQGLAFRITALVIQNYRLQDYFIHEDDDYASESLDGVAHGVLSNGGLLLLDHTHSPHLRKDAILVWERLQEVWPEFADIIITCQAEETFVQTTEIWLKTLLLQGHAPVKRDCKASYTFSDDSLGLLHRVVMGALRATQYRDTLDELFDPAKPNAMGVLPPGPVVQQIPHATALRCADREKRPDARSELRYMVLCVWMRKFLVVFDAKDNKELLHDRLHRLKYSFVVDDGLLGLIDARYHSPPSSPLTTSIMPAMEITRHATLGYFAGLGLSTVLSLSPLPVLGLIAGSFYGNLAAQDKIESWQDRDFRAHAQQTEAVRVLTKMQIKSDEDVLRFRK